MLYESTVQYLCVFVVLPLLQRPGGLELGDIGEEQRGLCPLPELQEPKVHTGYIDGHCGTLSKITNYTQKCHSNKTLMWNNGALCEDFSCDVYVIFLTLKETSTAKLTGS